MPIIPPDIYETLTSLNCEEVAMRLGLEVKRHKCRCFMHEDRRPSMSFFKNGQAWNCFVCNTGGSAIQLAMRYWGLDTYKAAVWLGREFGIWDPDTILPSGKLRPKIHYNPSKKEYLTEDKKFNPEIVKFILDNSSLSTEAKYFLFDERKLDPDVIERLGIKGITDLWALTGKLIASFPKERLLESGLVKEGKHGLCLRLWTPCLLFPYRDVMGNLIGIQSRYLGPNVEAPRFQFLSNSKTHLFNLPALRHLKADDTVYLSEGITDCLALLSNGMYAIGLPSATNIPTSDLPFLRGLNVIMVADTDNAGQRAISDVRESISSYAYGFNLLQIPKEYKDFSEFYVKHKSDKNEITVGLPVISNLTASDFIKLLQRTIKKHLKKLSEKKALDTDFDNSQEDPAKTRENGIHAHLSNWITLISDEIEKRECQKDKSQAGKDKKTELSKTKTREDLLLATFCHWLSTLQNGHYHLSYYYPNLKEFKSAISSIADHISHIVRIINLINRCFWNKILKEKAVTWILFDYFFKVKKGKTGIFTIDYDINKIDRFISSNGEKTEISLCMDGYQSLKFEVSAADLKNSKMTDMIQEKLDSIFEILKLGISRYEKR